jgi:hypothetical protein
LEPLCLALVCCTKDDCLRPPGSALVYVLPHQANARIAHPAAWEQEAREKSYGGVAMRRIVLLALAPAERLRPAARSERRDREGEASIES